MVYRYDSEIKMAPPGRPRQANLVLIAYASSEGSGEPAHPKYLLNPKFQDSSWSLWLSRPVCV